jgi:multisubunit Na+/H+ antiporter MnhG subunit
MAVANKETGKARRTEMRKFGLILGIAFGGLGSLAFLRARDSYVVLLALSAMFLVLGLFLPMILRPVHAVWMIAAEAIAWFMTRVILTIVFFVVVTPIGLLGRLFGKHFLDQQMENSRDTYWVYRDRPPAAGEDYEKQY